MDKNTYIKSPLNYVGGKYKLLPQILPLFPNNINTFVDLFCGGGNVGININANKIICNDILIPVIEFLNACKLYKSKDMIEKIHIIIDKFELSKTNNEGYLNLREHYNNGNKGWDIFYTLICYSFNNNIRFNNKYEFNIAFGKDRSSFNPKLKENFIKFIDHLKNKNIKFTSKDFTKLRIDNLTIDDFVYLDPPYLITVANYNENGGWNTKHEEDLLNLLDNLNKNNIKFALSNVLEHKGKSNDILKEWCKNYNVHNLNYNYGNSNYNTKDKSKNSSKEVLITNY
jgi:DNA adenine methylase Dam